MDDESFADAMQDVQPLAHKRKAQVASTGATEPTLSQQQRREIALGNTSNKVDPNPLTPGEVPQVQPLEVLEWKKDGVQHEVFAKLRTGGYAIESELDLHGMTVKEAREAVWKFLVRAMTKGWRCVLIAHGRGEKSATPARIKSYVYHWLCEHPDVNALTSAERHRGGTGAVYVLMRKAPQSSELTREEHQGWQR